MELQIKKTNNYNLFKFHPLNRPVTKDHINDLVVSIKRDNQLDINPIIVDSEHRIISGQHRFEAAKRLALPIYYIVKDVNDDYILLANQTQRRTNLADAINFYIETRDLEAYKILKKAHQEFNIPHGALASIIGELIGKTACIVNGTFELKESAKEAEAHLAQYRQIYHLLNGMPFEYKTSYKSTHFCQALRKLMDNEDIDWEGFIAKVRVYWSMLDCGMPTVGKWYEQMLKIYNKRKRFKIGEEHDDE